MVIGKRPRPIIGKLSELLIPGGNPLDFRIRSPRGMKNYDLGGVGLGIVAALEKSGDCRGRLAVRGSILKGMGGGGASPILIDSGKFRGCGDWSEMESLEDYTFVTCHGPEKSFTKVYYDGGEQGRSRNISGPAKEPSKWFIEDSPEYPTSDFLSCCYLCRKNLHGKDIFMYRGEKGFCSPECRSRQIMMDEQKERRCRSEVSRPTKVPVKNSGQIFSTGILVL